MSGRHYLQQETSRKHRTNMSNPDTGVAVSNTRARRRAASQDLDRGDAKSVAPGEVGSGSRAVIDVKDDDDEVQVLSPRSTTQVGNSRRHRKRIAIHTADEGRVPLLLEATSLGAASRRPIGGAPSRLSRSMTIDLTSGNDDDLSPIVAGKRKNKQVAPEASKDVQLTCTICMDTMKEETSTICGHIFCRPCIQEAIKTQKKCPTCRRKLTNSNVHRIYLSSGTK